MLLVATAGASIPSSSPGPTIDVKRGFAMLIPGSALIALYAAVWALSMLHRCCPAAVNWVVLAGGKEP